MPIPISQSSKWHPQFASFVQTTAQNTKDTSFNVNICSKFFKFKKLQPAKVWYFCFTETVANSFPFTEHCVHM